MLEQTLVKEIAECVQEVLKQMLKVPVGVSNRHVHLSQEDLNQLFGPDSKLNKLKALKQPGQYAAKEVVELQGPKGRIGKVRVLGPTRSKTQVEISISDGYTLGVKPPVRPSGDLDHSPGIKLIGPYGCVDLKEGVIAAHRHIHMTERDAENLGVKNGQKVSVKSQGNRALIFENVTCRVNKAYALELHLDVDEANAGLIKNGDLFEVLR